MNKFSRILGADTAFALISGVMLLRVYDCNVHEAKYEMISLLGPSKCPDPKGDYQTSKLESHKGRDYQDHKQSPQIGPTQTPVHHHRNARRPGT